MSRVLRMVHTEDPVEALWRRVGDLAGVGVLHNQLLVAIYKRPEMTKAGVILPGTSLSEDVHQGKVGLVVKKGPLAFVDDGRNQFHGQDVAVGSWVAYRVLDGWSLTINGPEGAVECRMLEDVHVKLVLTTPDEVY